MNKGYYPIRLIVLKIKNLVKKSRPMPAFYLGKRRPFQIDPGTWNWQVTAALLRHACAAGKCPNGDSTTSYTRKCRSTVSSRTHREPTGWPAGFPGLR